MLGFADHAVQHTGDTYIQHVRQAAHEFAVISCTVYAFLSALKTCGFTLIRVSSQTGCANNTIALAQTSPRLSAVYSAHMIGVLFERYTPTTHHVTVYGSNRCHLHQGRALRTGYSYTYCHRNCAGVLCTCTPGILRTRTGNWQSTHTAYTGLCVLSVLRTQGSVYGLSEIVRLHKPTQQYFKWQARPTQGNSRGHKSNGHRCRACAMGRYGL